MKIKRIQLKFGAAAILLLIIAWIVFAGSSASTSNSTNEKTYAWLTCQSFCEIAEHAAQANHAVFEISKVNTDDKSDLLALAKNWHNGTGFFIKTNFAVRGPTKVITIVSNWKLNTTEPSIGNLFNKNPAHIAGYSDGSVGLISQTEFTSLNLNGFVSSASLATNSEFNISKP